jgi:ethanolamine utilization protein EutQ (cupin superfamily)
MKKVITAQDIQEARKAGLTAVPVPPGAIITPQALDDARNYGIALQRESAVSTAAQPSAAGPPAQTVIPVRPVQAPAMAAVPISVYQAFPAASPQGHSDAASGPFTTGETQAARNLMAAAPVPATTPSAAPASPLPATMPAGFVAELISKQVAQYLGGTADMTRINAVVREVLGEHGVSVSTGAAQSASSGATTVSGAHAPVQSGNGAVLVRGREALPAQSAAADAVVVTDSLTPDAQGPGIGYLQLTDSSFDWTFAADDVLVVLEGELRLHGAGLDVKAGPGDAVRLSAGLSCSLTATGRVSCVYSAWPK